MNLHIEAPTAAAPAPQNGQPEQATGNTAVPADTAPRRPGGDRHIRTSTVAVVLALAGVAFYVSYRHQYDLAVSNGEASDTARLFPLTIDGVLITASLIMLYCARWKLAVPALARFALWLGIAATLAANVAHGWSAGWGGRLVSAAPAVALVIAYELLMWLIRTMRSTTPQPVSERVVYRDMPVEVPVEVEVRGIPADRFEAARWVVADALAAGRRPPGRRALADRFGLETREAVEILDQAAQDTASNNPGRRAPEAAETRAWQVSQDGTSARWADDPSTVYTWVGEGEVGQWVLAGTAAAPAVQVEVFQPAPDLAVNGTSRTGSA